jgi:hypothetical protein
VEAEEWGEAVRKKRRWQWRLSGGCELEGGPEGWSRRWRGRVPLRQTWRGKRRQGAWSGGSRRGRRRGGGESAPPPS